jgi:alkanesulfonate monooxygenase SsuD/methylene tetrahydromethanopterin reductase-like flavin-dependent oxidoreductase (luciferase family)
VTGVVAPLRVGSIPPPPAEPGPDAQAAVLRAMADAGCDHLVVGDHVCFFGGWGVDGLVEATALSMLHPTLPVHTSVYLLVLRHPVLVARQISTLAGRAPGRLVLGVGIGGEDRDEVRACSVDPSTRGRRMDECLAVLRPLLEGGAVDHDGEFFSLSSVSVRPAPPVPVPVVVGGRSTAAVRRAGRHGDGWLGIWVSPERFAVATAEAEAVALECGRGEIDWQHGMTVWCGLADDRISATQAVSRAMEGIYGLPFERFARYVPAGTPADVADALRPYVDAGCRTFNLLTQSPDPSTIPGAVGEVRRLLNAARQERHP